jgi:hypothetical protein
VEVAVSVNVHGEEVQPEALPVPLTLASVDPPVAVAAQVTVVPGAYPLVAQFEPLIVPAPLPAVVAVNEIGAGPLVG